MPPLRAILVGEARGINEAKYAHGFVGKSGVELARMLGQSGMAPAPAARYPNEREMIAYWQHLRGEHGIAIANVFEEHPPFDDILTFFGGRQDAICLNLPPLRPGKFLLAQYKYHLVNLYRFIREGQPNVVVALGNTAAWAMLGHVKISAIRGTTSMASIPEVV